MGVRSKPMGETPMQKRSGACSMVFCAAAGISMLGTVAAQSPGPGRVIAPGGELDESFGAGGKVNTDFHSLDSAWAVAVQPNGRIVAGGRADIGLGLPFKTGR